MSTKVIKHSSSRKKRWFIIAGLLVVAGIVALELTNTTHIFHKKKVPAIIPVNTSKTSSAKTNGPSSSAASSAPQSSSQNTKVASPVGGNTSGNLVQPYGDLVSNHRPGQNGSGTTEQSVCNTTPSATCFIQFTETSSGKVTKLPTQTVGSNGSTIWDWDTHTLTSGEWQIKAVASLNGQTKTVTDSIKLEVQ